jgi:hypothetical protein
LPPVPLRVHGHYSRAEIEAAFGVLSDHAPWIHREGVLWHEALFSPTTRYRDLALGPSLFHWESQSSTTAASPTGQRYVHHLARGSRVLLFARYESHEGERPMAIRWRWSGRFRRGGCQAVVSLTSCCLA